MNAEPFLHDPGDCRDEAARLLPWHVNGTLRTDETLRVVSHLEHCARCRADAQQLEAVRALMRSPAQVEPAPQAGWRRLKERLDDEDAAARMIAAERDATAARADRHDTTAARADERDESATSPWQRERTSTADNTTLGERATGPAVPSSSHVGRPSGPTRWLLAAVVIQSIALAAIVSSMLLSHEGGEPAAAYRTLASATAADGPRLRVVFAPSMTLAELQDLLRAHELVVVAGPSETGIFTLSLRERLAASHGAEAQSAVITRLRADARVRFVEPVVRDAPAR